MCDERGEYLQFNCINDGTAFFVDACDFEVVAVYKWRAMDNPSRFVRYVGRMEGSKTFLLHRDIMQPPQTLTVDHRDKDTFNNRRYNLRVCTIGQNLMNRHNFKRTASGFRGVYGGATGRWYAVISIGDQNKKLSLGGFDSPEAAARAWDAEAFARRGEFAQLNFPNDLS